MSDNPELQESYEFRAWVETLPDKHWAKYDLSACRLGWEAGRAAHLVASAAPTDREGVLSEAIEAARRIGNFRDLRRDELTADFGQPRFDMMNRIIEAIEELKSIPAPAEGNEAPQSIADVALIYLRGCLSREEENGMVYVPASTIRHAIAALRQEQRGAVDYFGALVEKARATASKASAKFPQPNYVTLKIAEEAGEVVRGAVHYAENRMKWSEVEGEIVQLLAMLIRFVTEGDEVNGVRPPSALAATPVHQEAGE